MVLTTYNGQTAVRCYTVEDTLRLLAILQDRGYTGRIKIIKARKRSHPRHFIVRVFPSVTGN